MKNLAIFCVLVFGCAAVAGATTWNVSVTTAAAADNLQIGFAISELNNVGTLDGQAVNEIDIRETSIGGTYLNGAQTIPSNAALVGIAGTFYFTGGPAYLYQASSKSGPGFGNVGNTQDWSFGDLDYPGWWAGTNVDQSASRIAFDTKEPNPAFAAVGTNDSGNGNIFDATAITYAAYTNNNNYDLFPHPYPGNIPYTQYDPGLLAAFYVSPSVTGVQFYTTNGQAWNVANSTGGYSQMQFGYGGGRTAYVEITATASPEPATLALLGSGLLGLLAYAWKRRK